MLFQRPFPVFAAWVVPLASMFGYATDLRSKTQGRATYSMEPSHFVELPKSLQEKIIHGSN